MECLADSDCMANGGSIEECSVADPRCKALRLALFSCKRGQLDMRKRIKGNMPAEPNPDDESGA